MHVASSSTDTLQEAVTCDIGWVSHDVREFCGIDKNSTVNLTCSQLWGQVNHVSEYSIVCADLLMQC